MPDKSSRLRGKTDSQSPPQIDGQVVENEILLSLPAIERDQIFPLLTFIGATFIGLIPLSFIYARLGWGLNAAFASHQRLNLHSLLQPPILIALAALALLSLSPIIIRRLRRRPAA